MVPSRNPPATIDFENVFFPVWNQGQHQKAMGFHSFFHVFSMFPGVYHQEFAFFSNISRWKSKVPSDWPSKAVPGHWAPCSVNRSPKSMRPLGWRGFQKRGVAVSKTMEKMWMSWENMGKVLLFTMFLPMFWQKSIHQHMKSIFWDFMGGWPSRNPNVVMESHHF